MKKTSMMRQIEARYMGLDIRQIVAAAQARHPRFEGAAAELGITRRCLENWLERFAAENGAEPAGAAR